MFPAHVTIAFAVDVYCSLPRQTLSYYPCGPALIYHQLNAVASARSPAVASLAVVAPLTLAVPPTEDPRLPCTDFLSYISLLRSLARSMTHVDVLRYRCQFGAYWCI